MSLEIISAIATALKNGSEGAWSNNWELDDGEAGFWINYADYQSIVDAMEGKSPWRPIVSAPKNGNHITVVNANNPDIPPTTVHWFVDPKEGGGWHLSVNQMGEYSDYVWGPPTHWMPSYPSPIVENKGDRQP